MGNLLKIELFKIFKGKEKNVIILSFTFMILSPLISIFLSESSFDKEFLSNIYRFFEYNFSTLFPLSIGIFSIWNIGNEFKNKTIKYYIMSKYSRFQMLIAKFFSINIFTIICFLITYILYCIIAYLTSDKVSVIVNFETITTSSLILNLSLIGITTIFYIIAIVTFSITLAYIFKRQNVAILIFIIITSLMLLLFGGIYELSIIPRYSFFYASELYTLIWQFNNFHMFLRYILPCVSNIFILLILSSVSFDKYKYK